MSAMKKTAVLELTLNPNNASESRTKAMQLAATIARVESINLRGENPNELVVQGKEIDATELTVLLRKKLGGARLVDYAPVMDETQMTVKERCRRLSFCHDSCRERADPSSYRHAYPDRYNYHTTYPDPCSYTNSFPYSHGHCCDYSGRCYYHDQPRINHEPYPIEQIEYFSYHDV